ncbi:cysteine desulfurase family protein [Streptococcus panodentis]|uniref:cysteine desulfurase n=1 Tax=Streptococcus panodentis TaxID=1581472 RepID=A0ABS5AX15_9STRE|nr:cysteine desulfurase [Streptococcus panodentis]
MIYLDNAATTPLSAAAIKAMTEALTVFGNPSSIHGHGREASKLLRQARAEIAQILHTESRHILFTSGGTESNNTAIKGYALRHQDRGKHIITTAIEHHAVLETVEYLVEKFGFEATVIQPVDGQIRAIDIQQALRPDTILVSVMAVNNETGDLLPIKEIGQLLKDHPAAFHVDAVQAIGKVPLYPKELGIDFLSASAHKFHGPKGVGFLYADRMDFDRFLHGGDQEEKHRAGTENLLSILGMTAALSESAEHLEENLAHAQLLKDRLLTDLAGLDFYVNESPSSLPYVINLGFPQQKNDLLLLQLDLKGFSVSTGSACTAGTVQPSHVLQALYGDDSERLGESIRISTSDQNTIEEIDYFSKTLKEILGG